MIYAGNVSVWFFIWENREKNSFTNTVMFKNKSENVACNLEKMFSRSTFILESLVSPTALYIWS